ncbi:uncharacterized protein LOC128999064 [Macrosteles quadrilineatus]|uniref:uncharacterized protein LOC128999064 n=1 Tax=Macrosteles quadrilineatus TaxID=74068 RepID=UPI0023E32CF6|nr:uncharacterized protein LOC128999064 [Macrosteles quadrilineatus]
MGFKWKKCGSKRKCLIERLDIVNWRFKYLREIRKLREQKRKIFYLDETWMDSNLTFQKCWQSVDVDGVLPDMNASNRVIVVDIGSNEGFLQGGRLIYKGNSAKGDYHGQMNFSNFEKWIRERVLPNLPSNSVIVIDNAPYHGEQEDKVPNKSSTKKVMVEWLSKHGKDYEEMTTRKAELFEAIERLKPPQKVYKIDNLKYILTTSCMAPNFQPIAEMAVEQSKVNSQQILLCQHGFEPPGGDVMPSQA